MKNNTTDQDTLTEYQEHLLLAFAHDEFVEASGWYEEGNPAWADVLAESIHERGVPKASIGGVFSRAHHAGLIDFTIDGGVCLTDKGRKHTLDLLVFDVAMFGKKRDILPLKSFIKFEADGINAAGQALGDLYKEGDLTADEFNEGFANLIDIVGGYR